MKPIMRGNVSRVLEKNMLNVYHIIYITIFMAELGGIGAGDRGQGVGSGSGMCKYFL